MEGIMKHIHSAIGLMVYLCLTVWAVPLWAAYVDNGDGTVTDTSTGLIWQQNAPDDIMNWEQALAYCEALSLADKTDWRLPSINELRSLVDYGRRGPSIDTTYFPNARSTFYWSSTTYASDTTSAWCVYFLDGGGYSNQKTAITQVRAVRRGETVSCVPDIKANGQDGRVILSSGTTLTITVSLSPGDQIGETADWWVLADAWGNKFSFTPMGWILGTEPYMQYPLFGISDIQVFSGLLPIGEYSFYFGVDTNPNGIVDSQLFYDHVVVIVGK
jgi:hypothetical protein